MILFCTNEQLKTETTAKDPQRRWAGGAVGRDVMKVTVRDCSVSSAQLQQNKAEKQRLREGVQVSQLNSDSVKQPCFVLSFMLFVF